MLVITIVMRNKHVYLWLQLICMEYNWYYLNLQCHVANMNFEVMIHQFYNRFLFINI